MFWQLKKQILFNLYGFHRNFSLYFFLRILFILFCKIVFIFHQFNYSIFLADVTTDLNYVFFYYFFVCFYLTLFRIIFVLWFLLSIIEIDFVNLDFWICSLQCIVIWVIDRLKLLLVFILKEKSFLFLPFEVLPRIETKNL